MFLFIFADAGCSEDRGPGLKKTALKQLFEGCSICTVRVVFSALCYSLYKQRCEVATGVIT